MAIHAPELDGALAWLNVDRPLTLRELRGQVVVLDFWTYCCINCMHVIPTLRAIEHALAGEPLVVIGVHSAKFAEEKDPERIAEAVARYQVEHPIAVDDSMRIWRAFAVRSWPTLVVIRPDGTIAAVAPGEPDRAMLEDFLRRQLAEARANGTLADKPFAIPHTKPQATGALSFPGKISVDGQGRIAVADSGHHRVLLCESSGRVIAAAGTGLSGLVDGALSEAAFDDPQGVAFADGKTLVADARNHALREVDWQAGTVRTIAGTGELSGRMPREAHPAREVALRSPWDLAVDGNRVYVAMAGSHQLWVHDRAAETIAPFAGSGAEALVDGPLASSAFAQPSGLWLDHAARRLYVADSETSAVRVIDLEARRVGTLVGEGLFDFGDVDGDFLNARLQHDLAVCGRVEDGKTRVYVADTYNSKIKRLELDEKRIAAAFGGDGALNEPGGMCFAPDGSLWVADTNHHRVVRLDSTLRTAEPITLTGAPAPLSGIARARSGSVERADASGWFTAQLELPDGAALAPGRAAIALTLEAPPGFEVAAGSPLRVLVEVSRRPDLLHVAEEHRLQAAGGAHVPLTLPAEVQPLTGTVESEVVATLDFVACDKSDRAVCTPARAHLRIPVRLAPDGAASLAFTVPLPRP